MAEGGKRRLDFRFQHSGFRFRFDGLPLAERAALGGHSEFCPCAASALAAAAGGVQCLGVPLRAGAAGGFAGGEDFGRGGLEARAGEAVRGVAESCHRIFSKFSNGIWRVHEKTIFGVGFIWNPS